MGQIKILPEQVTNKIAAGEVIERPASVVKELVENSIDAGSQKIKVRVKSGGKKLIQVIDNGNGMSKEDARLAFERHATSKIEAPNDLFSLRTLGFRGEALASIAAVSRLELQTKPEDKLEGFRMKIKGGEVTKEESYGCAKGTNIIVKDLFFNTPVRYKYLKQDNTEMRHISRIVSRLALAYPNISFKLVHNGNNRFETSGNGRLVDVIYNLYGSDVARKMVKVEHQEDYMEVEGYISRPEITRSNKRHQSFFVNGRYIRSNLLSKAVLDAYKSVLTVNNYPIVALKLNLNPILVDVNIHPTKLRAKFSRKGQVFDLVKNGVKASLKNNVVPDLNLNQSKNTQGRKNKTSSSQSSFKKGFSSYKASKKNKKEESKKRKEKLDMLFGKDELNLKQELKTTQAEKTEQNPTDSKEKEEKDYTKERDDLSQAAEDKQDYDNDNNQPVFTPIAQVQNSYLLAQNETGLFIIDQHAAHEQVIYNQLLAKAEQGKIQIQSLLMPLRFQLSPEESELISDKQEKLQQLGFEIEEFGNNEYVIQGVPTLLDNLDDKNEIINTIEEVLNEEKVEAKDFVAELLTGIACKAAIKAGDRLAMSEMKQLLADINKYDITNCPHGRPIMLNLSWSELEKNFKRK